MPRDFNERPHQNEKNEALGYVRTLIDQVRILSSKLLRSREQMNEKAEKQEKKASILGKIKDYQKNDKSNDLAKKENKGQER